MNTRMRLTEPIDRVEEFRGAVPGNSRRVGIKIDGVQYSTRCFVIDNKIQAASLDAIAYAICRIMASFCAEITPCLHITKWFVGEDPFDRVTQQYNETMRRILPEYDIEFIGIPRKELGGGGISASHVRELLERWNFDSVKRLVPEITFEYLVRKFPR